jgi:imidazoleglycerol-phosphate dehydratase
MRSAEITRKTNETDIRLKLNLDGNGRYRIHTGLGFLDHMLGHIALHGMFDLELEAQGDLEVDPHHTLEDCALALGQALDLALGERKGIVRMGWAYVPMDESLAFVSLDLSGRPYSVIQAEWHTPMVGLVPTSLMAHFLESLAVTARMNLHARVLYGRDDHHQAEALFKALGRALDEATRMDPRRQGTIPSTKGKLV